ncbi:hypothetical protein ISF6_5295 [Piscinibacter sakaiensis]|uniref:OmpR/PhoB-type domain-containing protein n=2 Tax=Piscinibacter sakaiensis TaxID=1547922 RepID=A0A0K8P7Y8_PISS1|nr:hypothetical protein ISF6_5295 [Piscinibacter sakaiensis]
MRFARYTLDRERRQLLADGQPVPIGGRAFDLLDELVRHAGRTVSTEALRRAVWPDRKVGDNNLRVQITALRKLLGEGVIALHATRGYRFTLPVDAGSEDDGARAAPAPPGNLPAQGSPLCGRDEALAAITEALGGQVRLTLVGPAGIGKTALARAAALARRDAFPDGAWWVELAALTELPQIVARVGALLQIDLPPEGALEALVRVLSERRLLLVLDNAEHLVDAVSAFADALLRHAPRVALLATSRRALRCAGEQLQRIGPLSLPQQPGLAAGRRSGAVAWFEARARRADPGFALTDANVDAVTELCRRLDGVALAIGLAAARLPALGLAGLHERLGDRLRLLTSGATDPRGHPLALSAALDWSFGLLAERERTVLCRLSVFSGSFSAGAAQALAADDTLDAWEVLAALDGLIEHSLLACDPASLQSAGAARHRLHESVRVYARARLDERGETPALQRRLALDLRARLTGPAEAGRAPPDRMAVTLPDADLDDLRAALAWAAEHDPALALGLAVDATPCLRRRAHHHEGRRIALGLLADPRCAAYPQALLGLRLALAALCFEQHALDETLAHAEAALQAARAAAEPDHARLGEAWSWIGVAQQMRGAFAPAEPALRQALVHHRLAGPAQAASLASDLNNLALVMVEQARFDEAQPLFEEALAVNRAIGRDWGVAVTLENLGEAAYARGDAVTARARWEEALPTMRRLAHVYQESLLLGYLALALRRLGEPVAAEAHAQESLRLALSHRLPALAADALVPLAGLALDRGDAMHCAVLLHVAQRQRGAAVAIGPTGVEARALAAASDAALGAAARVAARLQAERLGAEHGLAGAGRPAR